MHLALHQTITGSHIWLLLACICSYSCNPLAREHYFWNEITGELQWEDPGGVPHEDPHTGQRYWLSPTGERLQEDPQMFAYAWVEQYSQELKRHYFYNQETRETTWERPVDLAWRRVPAPAPPP